MATAPIVRHFSGSTDGKPIKIAATATAGTAIHTAVSGTTDGTYDQFWLYATNNDTVARTITLEVGSADAPDGNITVTLPSKSGSIPIIAGDVILRNEATLKAFASAANVICVHGYVNRMVTG